MLRTFLKNSAIYSGSRVLSRGITIFLVPFYTRVLSPSDYGIIDLLNILISMTVIVFPLQITQAVARFYADSENEDESRSISSTALFFTIFVLSVFVGITQIMPNGISKLLIGDADYDYLIRILGFAAFMNGMFYFAQNQLKWMQLPVNHTIASLAQALTTIAFSVLFVLLLGYGLIGVLLGQILGSLIGCILSLYYGRDSYRFLFSTNHLSTMLAFSLPLVVAEIFIFGINIISRISLKELATLEDLGLYAIGFKVASLATIIMVGVTSSLYPMIYAEYRNSGTPAKMEQVFRITLKVAMIVTVATSVFSKEILFILAPPVYYSAADVIPYLMASQFITNLMVFIPGLRIHKNSRYIAWTNFFACIFCIAMNIVLIKSAGNIGAAIATLMTSIFLFIVIGWGSQRRYYIPYRWGLYSIPAGLSALIIASYDLIEIESWILHFGVKTLICIAASGLIFMFLTSRDERIHYLENLRKYLPSAN